MKKILISAFIGSRNLGDEAIFRSILSNLNLSEYEITAASVNEEKTKKFGVNTVFVKDLSSLMKAIRGSDLMLVGGGGIIQDQSSILNFLYYSFQLWYAKRHKVPVILMFVGVGPLKFGLSKAILRRLIPSLAFSIVRDEKSAKTMMSLGARSDNILQAHDPVLNFPLNKDQTSMVKPIIDGDYALLSLRRWFFANPFLPVFITRNLNRLKPFNKRYTKYMKSLAADLDEYLEANKHMKLVAVSLYDGEDDVVNNDLVSSMRNSDRVVLAPLEMDEYEYLSIAKSAKFVIGMRLHSLILGSAVSKPFVALRYSAKVDEFTEQMKLTHYSIHVERYDSNKLVAALEAMTGSSEELAKLMSKNLSKYQAANEKAFIALENKIAEIVK